MRPLGRTPYPHHSPVGVGQAAGDCDELCVCLSWFFLFKAHKELRQTGVGNVTQTST